MFVKHINCNICGSSDAKALYNDDTSYCFSCSTYSSVTAPEKKSSMDKFITEQSFYDLPHRKILASTCKKYTYFINDSHNEIANYYNTNNKLSAQKVRAKREKSFFVLGDLQESMLFGANLFNKAQKIIITEGEIDALTVYQVTNLPTVSIGNGVNGAYKHIQNNLEYFDDFETVIIFFDNDKHGIKYAKKVAELFEFGKCKLAKILGFKDANEALVANESDAIINAIETAKDALETGIIESDEIWQLLIDEKNNTDDDALGVPYPYDILNNKLSGMRKPEMILVTAGSGAGKTLFCKELVHNLAIKYQKNIGIMMLEEDILTTSKGLMSFDAGYALDQINLKNIKEEVLKKHFNATFSKNNIFIYNHFGTTTVENITKRLVYLAKRKKCNFILLDHVSMLFSGSVQSNERMFIDETITKLRALVQQLNICLIIVSHLSRPEGSRGHENGAEVSVRNLRGSHSLAQLSNTVIALERNQQSNDIEQQCLITVRILKNRFKGQTGIAGTLIYNINTNRIEQ